MKTTRRMKRMTRNKLRLGRMNLTSLMDVFTILVFFLLVNSGTPEVLETPNEMVLPESSVDAKPRETVVIFIGKEQVTVQGEPVATVESIAAMGPGEVGPIIDRLVLLEERIIGASTKHVAGSQEITLLADRSIPFDVIRRVMSTCTSQGYNRISLAVIQKGQAGESGADQVAQI